MNSKIEQLLQKCRVAKIPEHSKEDNKIIIKRNNPGVECDLKSFRIDHYYIIKLQKYLIYPPDNFTLNTNWNKGINPRSSYMLVTPIKFLGKMIQFDGCGYDLSEGKPLDDTYSGIWFPTKSIEIVLCLE